MRITLRWNLSVYLSPWTNACFCKMVVCKYLAFGCSE